MNFFDNIFQVKDDNYYGVSGLTPELNCIYVYEAFLKCNGGVLVVVNSLYEANILFSKLVNYTDRVLFLRSLHFCRLFSVLFLSVRFL